MCQVQPKYVTTLNDAECILMLEEEMPMVNTKRSLELKNLLGMPVQVWCTTPGSEQLKTLQFRNYYSDSALTAPEIQEEMRSYIEGALH